MIHLIIGRGAPDGQPADGRYLADCWRAIQAAETEHRLLSGLIANLEDVPCPESPLTVFLAGGPDGEDVATSAEAGEMLDWFLRHGHDRAAFRLIDGPPELKTVLELLLAEAGPEAPVNVLCGYADQDHVRLLARHLFWRPRVVPIRTARHGRNSRSARLGRLVRLPFQTAVWYLDFLQQDIRSPFLTRLQAWRVRLFGR